MTDDLDYESCGTYAGYNQHMRDKTRVCPACRAAATEYHRKWRASRPEYKEQERFMNQVRSRALWALASRHPGEFQLLIDEEIRKESGS